jgi:autotransporter family porin
MSGSLDLGTTAIGTLNVSGDYTQTATGKLTLKLGGVGAGQYDQLNVSGTATLAGTLQLNSFNNFVPVKGNKFAKIIHGGKALAGTFGTITDTTGSGLAWTQTPGANDLDITGN